MRSKPTDASPETVDTRSEVKGELFLDILQSTGIARLAVTGASMLPAIWPGDVLEVERRGADEISPGDVVLFTRQGGYTAHRVVAKTRTADRPLLITRGDALPAPDDPISPEQLLGRVVAVLRGGRRLEPRPTRWGRAAAWILARSEFCVRLVLRLRRVAQSL